jgi:hypothetical protein
MNSVLIGVRCVLIGVVRSIFLMIRDVGGDC